MAFLGRACVIKVYGSVFYGSVITGKISVTDKTFVTTEILKRDVIKLS